MKKIVIDRESRTYQFAQKYGGYRELKHDHDICAFRRALVLGFLKIAFLASTASLVYSALVVGVFMSYRESGWGFWWSVVAAIFTPALTAVAIVAAFCAVCATFEFIFTKIERRREKLKEEIEAGLRQPSALRETYRSWKEKYCAKVEFK